MTVIGQFRDLDDPDRFVWLRGFRDMASRHRALTDFYGGPAWKKHRDAANATMVDWSDVLLLKPARPASGFPIGTVDGPGGLLICATHTVPEPAGEELIRRFEETAASLGLAVAASFVTESSPNDYTALPVREGENVLVWFSRFARDASKEELFAATGALGQRLGAPPEIRRLEPTSRSRLGASAVRTTPPRGRGASA